MEQQLPTDLIEQVLHLPEAQRIELANQIHQSLETYPFETDETKADWDQELERRLADSDAGHTPGIPAAQVMQELREQQRARSTD